MQALGLIAVAILTAPLLAALANFRFLLYPLLPKLNPLTTAMRLDLEGNALFISDLHLRYGQPFVYSAAFQVLLKDRQVSNLIVDGDLFDSPEDEEDSGQRYVSFDWRSTGFGWFTCESVLCRWVTTT